LGVQAAREALRLLPGDGRPHYALALLYASVLPENASAEDLKPVMDELKIVEKLEPALAPNIHDALDFLGAIWAVETARAEASALPEPSATQAAGQEGRPSASAPATLASVTGPEAVASPGRLLTPVLITILVILAVLVCLIWIGFRARAKK
jgi:hypothetical protein